MFIGFDNGFVIDKIFGENDVFTGAIIENIDYRPLSGRFTLDVITKSIVVHPPKKWKSWDFVCLSIELFGIKEAHIEINHQLLVADVFKIKHESNLFVLEIENKTTSSIICKFVIARVQRVLPMKYNDEIEKYENALN